ncbi:MAG: helix-turn-helix transcriptional regulator [Saccharothrix sp.]|nr:helix-turn-helix transcriptional regulator [Saccharothrix sp.]
MENASGHGVTTWWRFIEELLDRHHLTRAEFARRVSIAASAVTGWQAGREPTPAVLHKVAKTFDVPVTEALMAAGWLSTADLDPRVVQVTQDLSAVPTRTLLRELARRLGDDDPAS